MSTKNIGEKMVMVRKYSVGADDLTVYAAWEPSTVGGKGKHEEVASINGEWYGRIGTRHLPSELKILPEGDERVRATEKWLGDQWEEAYDLILEAFPEARIGRCGMGEITLLERRLDAGERMEIEGKERKDE